MGNALPANFRAETNPRGHAIDLVWEFDPSFVTDPDTTPLIILRRERRFPGQNRQGTYLVEKQWIELPTGVTPEQRTQLPGAFLTEQEDGFRVYETTTFRYDLEELQEEVDGTHLITTTRQYRVQGDPPDRPLIRSIRREFALSPNGEVSPEADRLIIRFTDREGLEPGTIYYYTAYYPILKGSSQCYFNSETQSSALATKRYSHALFTDLPQIHQQLDTTLPPQGKVAAADQTKGQLQRLLEVFDAHADMLQGSIDGLRDLHNVRRVDSRLLPHLAHLLGWRMKRNLNEDAQRTEIGFAPQVYRGVGTIPTMKAMINRLTGWNAEVREFARNVLVSVDTTRFEQLEGVRVYLDGSLKLTPAYNDYFKQLRQYLNGELKDQPDPPQPPDRWQSHPLPAGAVNTLDSEAMFNLKNQLYEDRTAYSYDCRQLKDNENPYQGVNQPYVGVYNQRTIGIYLFPDIETETLAIQETVDQIRQTLAEFLPIQVRLVFFILPQSVVEEVYDTPNEITEKSADEWQDWLLFISNRRRHQTVDTSSYPIDTRSRTWYPGVKIPDNP
jgi:phage tail-like protein